jgi:hypothetical protein
VPRHGLLRVRVRVTVKVTVKVAAYRSFPPSNDFAATSQCLLSSAAANALEYVSKPASRSRDDDYPLHNSRDVVYIPNTDDPRVVTIRSIGGLRRPNVHLSACLVSKLSKSFEWHSSHGASIYFLPRRAYSEDRKL